VGAPPDPDTDNDGVLDGPDNCKFTPNTDQKDADEVKVHQTDPRAPDTDGDLFGDGNEVERGSNPKNPFSIPGPTGPIIAPVPPPSDQMPITDDLDPLFP